MTYYEEAFRRRKVALRLALDAWGDSDPIAIDEVMETAKTFLRFLEDAPTGSEETAEFRILRQASQPPVVG